MIRVFMFGVLVGLVAPMAIAQKRIALTYDDAPRADGRVFSGDERAEALIGALADVEAGPVAFFVTTQFLSKGNGAERIKKYAAAGHFIANHTHSHPWANRTEVDAFLAEIDRAEAALAQFDNRRPWFRFPFLDEGREQGKVDAIVAGLDARGLQNGYVTVDNYDWQIEQRLQQAIRDGKSVDYEKLGRFYVGMLLYAAEYYDSLAVQELGYSPVHTLLLHENDLAALYADDLVRGFRQAGWDIVSPEEAYDHPLPAPESLRTGQGRIVGLASDAGRPASTMWTWAIDEAMVDLQLERSGAFGEPADSLCTPPPATPEILGPGEVSLEDRFEFGQTITANCKDLFVGIEHGVWQSVEHYRRTEKGWTHIRRIAGSESLSANDPYVTPDGERLYYIRHEGENTQIAYLDRKGVSSWSEPIILPPPVNTPAKEFYITFDVNGDLIFSSNRGRGDYNLYRAVLQGDKYVSVELLPENINSRGYEADPFIAPDGSYLLFASNRQGGKGRGDIYVSFKQSDGWSDPKPVEAINTAAHELCPFVSADGKTLYFTSNEDLYVVDTSILDQYR